MSKNIGLIYLLFKFSAVVCTLGLDTYRSNWFDLVVLDNSQSSSLHGYLNLEIASSSSTRCATRCIGNQNCQSFLLDKSSGICKLFNRGVDPRSGKDTGTLSVYTKRATCEDIGYVTLKSANKCLKSHHTPLSWINANETCVMEGGSLISITTTNMLEEVYNLTTATDPSLTLVHIDGNDFNQEGNWVYNNGLPMSFLPWDFGQPQGGMDENCMLLLNGKFHDAPCDSLALKFLCERLLVI
ncbi:uncharacterized protein LOC128161162 isoform X1 [Crassostrea angulata]|uniref:uncharacterized protein LOC128161162 isoform X1 n=1 Tax=Magallana angulata TaxID=2784310 RepID=UPI0022B1B2A1|nr:uncharacterized protein LOC128161162 isoform X1 [Crassostrea angulata]